MLSFLLNGHLSAPPNICSFGIAEEDLAVNLPARPIADVHHFVALAVASVSHYLRTYPLPWKHRRVWFNPASNPLPVTIPTTSRIISLVRPCCHTSKWISIFKSVLPMAINTARREATSRLRAVSERSFVSAKSYLLPFFRVIKPPSFPSRKITTAVT